MIRRSQSKSERIVLVLQGGGALGAYQAGAYEALAEAGHTPDWIAGISIGAINAAIIAGNTEQNRIPRLRAFWNRVSSGVQASPLIDGTQSRELFNYLSAAYISTVGVPGFFEPRFPPPMVMPAGSPAALSVYDPAPLKTTLEQLVDFELLEGGPVRLSVGAVNIRSGNFAYFDSADQRLQPEHIMASGALPPGLPPVIIEGEAYWDGGLVSNTPLQYILDYTGDKNDKCIFQVDLFSARGAMPQNLFDVAQREKEIRFSSRTRLNTDSFEQMQTLRLAADRLLAKLPAELRADPDAELLQEYSCTEAITIVHLIHRRAAYETHAQDYEFSRLSIEEHWQAGRNDVARTLRHPKWRNRERADKGVRVLDLAGG
jgi:NTE family protein